MLRDVLSGCSRIGVLDRNISLGLGGVLWSESCFTAPSASLVQSYMIGLGGGDIRIEHIENVLADLSERTQAGEPQIVEVTQ
jgi:pyruvate/2-oxoacid:ferredoxin oxidoreductase alpha subunit